MFEVGLPRLPVLWWLAVLACGSGEPALTDGVRTGPELRGRLLPLVPRGMPVDSARAALERHGFRCLGAPAAGVHGLQCERTAEQKRTRWAWRVTFHSSTGAVERFVTAVERETWAWGWPSLW